MSAETVARRYAGALYEEAEAQGLVETIDEDVAFVQASLENSRELVQFFESPLINRDHKEAIVEELFADRVHALTLRLLHMLVRKGREEITPDLPRAYRTLRDEQEGIIEARVRTAVELTKEEEEALADRLASATDRQVRLEVTTDPDLIGGLIVRIGDTVYDGSVGHQLDELRQRFRNRSLAVLTNGSE
jgi:F-type H+-transporting ATPase subunit delta